MLMTHTLAAVNINYTWLSIVHISELAWEITGEFGAGTKSRPDCLITQLFHRNKPWNTILCYLQLCLETSFWMKLPLYLMPWISETISVQCFCFVIWLLAGKMNAGTVCCLFSQFYTSFASCEPVKTLTCRHVSNVLPVTVRFNAFLIHTFSLC